MSRTTLAISCIIVSLVYAAYAADIMTVRRGIAGARRQYASTTYTAKTKLIESYNTLISELDRGPHEEDLGRLIREKCDVLLNWNLPATELEALQDKAEVIRFVGEHPSNLLRIEQESIPDDLSVTVNNGAISLSGVCRYSTATIQGAKRGHFGKAIRNRSHQLAS